MRDNVASELFMINACSERRRVTMGKTREFISDCESEAEMSEEMVLDKLEIFLL